MPHFLARVEVTYRFLCDLPMALNFTPRRQAVLSVTNANANVRLPKPTSTDLRDGQRDGKGHPREDA